LNNLKITKIFGFFAVFVLALFLYSVPSQAGFVINDTTGGDCSTHDWVADTKTCTLTGTVTMDVSFADNDITLDCNGNTIDGLGASQNGVSISGRKGIVVKRCIIDDWNTGIIDNGTDSTDDGFTVESGTSGFNFEHNIADDNVEFGIQDLSTGKKTAGTANTYEGNTCGGNGTNPSDPAGLCN